MATVIYGLLVVLGLVLLTVTAVRVTVGGVSAPAGWTAPGREPRGGSARRVLDERYAAGELTTEEYQHRLRVLEGSD